MLKIATWNIERPNESSKTRNAKIVEALRVVDADILILTETNSIIHPGKAYVPLATSLLPPQQETFYRAGENRTTIWTKYPTSQSINTYDDFTSICSLIKTPLGHLSVYGTIIGIHGNRRKSFNNELAQQLAEWQSISASGNLCIAGDFNISFADNYYYTKEGRKKINDCFKALEIVNLTQNIPQNIDHIAISSSFLKSLTSITSVWNEDKKLSDHIGVSVTLSR